MRKLTLTVLVMAFVLPIVIRHYRAKDTPHQSSLSIPTVQNVTNKTFDLGSLPKKGNSGATIILVEFSDYECPFCAKYAADALPFIEKEFIRTGKLRYAFVNNPLSMHHAAKGLAIAAICAGEQGKYWQMNEALFKMKPRTKSAVLLLVSDLGLDVSTFQKCVGQEFPERQLKHDMELSAALQLKVTPAFAIGKIDSSGRITILKVIEGAQPLQVFKKEIESVLGESPL